MSMSVSTRVAALLLGLGLFVPAVRAEKAHTRHRRSNSARTQLFSMDSVDGARPGTRPRVFPETRGRGSRPAAV